MVKDGEGPYDSTGDYPVGYAAVGSYMLSHPALFVIVRTEDLRALEAQATGVPA